MTDREFVKQKGLGNKFVKIKCPDCNNEQVTYTRISSEIQCSVCGATIAKPTGGTFSTVSETVEDVK